MARIKDEEGNPYPIHRENPWLNQLINTSKTRNKIITSVSKDKRAVITDAEGNPEEMLPTGFYYKKKVESNQFVKIYTSGIAEIMGLSRAGAKVFHYLFDTVSDVLNKNMLIVQLKYEHMQEDERYFSKSGKPISKATYYKGIRDLIAKQFIAQSDTPSLFFINPTYMFNGDRLVIVHEIFKEKEKHMTRIGDEMEEIRND